MKFNSNFSRTKRLLIQQFGKVHKIKFEVILTVHRRYYVEIKCQLDATDYIYCRFYCMLNMFRAILCPKHVEHAIKSAKI